MTKFTKERLNIEAEALEHFATNLKWTNVRVAQSLLFAADAMRQLLASMEQEPVVPAETRNRFRAEGLAELLKDVRDYAPLTAEQWETLTNNWHQTFVGLSGEGDACRAAMLNTHHS